MTLLDSDQIIAFLTNEAEERLGYMKPTDLGALRDEDLAFLKGLEVAAQIVRTLADLKEGKAA